MENEKNPNEMLECAENLLAIIRMLPKKKWQQTVLEMKDDPVFGVRMRSYILLLLGEENRKGILAMMSAAEKQETEKMISLAAEEIRQDERRFEQALKELKPRARTAKRTFAREIKKRKLA